MALIMHLWEVPKDMRRKFQGAYRRGWNYSDNIDDPDNEGLDGNPCGGVLYWAWEDGYMDRATDREYGHLLQEHNHDDPDECQIVEEKLHAVWLKTLKK